MRTQARRLFATRVENGLLGPFRFDRNGDITEAPITIFRVADGRGLNRVASVEGGVLECVVRPSASLVAARDESG